LWEHLLRELFVERPGGKNTKDPWKDVWEAHTGNTKNNVLKIDQR